jgi:hypothetical protein
VLGPLIVLATDPSYSPYLAGVVVGFVVGTAGHVFKAPAVILLGIAIIGATMVLFIIATDPHGLGTGRAPGPS